LLTENDIAFLKWDYNRNWSEPGWDAVPWKTEARVRGIHPQFVFDSGGPAEEASENRDRIVFGRGGRVDLGILR